MGKFSKCFDRLASCLRDGCGIAGLTSTLTHFSWDRVLYSFMRIRSAMMKGMLFSKGLLRRYCSMNNKDRTEVERCEKLNERLMWKGAGKDA